MTLLNTKLIQFLRDSLGHVASVLFEQQRKSFVQQAVCCLTLRSSKRFKCAIRFRIKMSRDDVTNRARSIAQLALATRAGAFLEPETVRPGEEGTDDLNTRQLRGIGLFFSNLLALTKRALQWIGDFFVELSQLSLAFWNVATVGQRRDLALSIFPLGLVVLARNPYAAYDDVIDSATAFAVVVISAAVMAFSLCLADPICKEEYRRKSTACYRIMLIGVFISATFISSNNWWPWASKVSVFFQIDEEQERTWVLSLPAAAFAIAMLLLISLRDKVFRFAIWPKNNRVGTEAITVSSGSDTIRIWAWTGILFISIFILDWIMFSIHR